METVCFRIKLKPGSIEGVRIWFKTLKEREAETLKTLENEDVIVESVFLDKHGENFYLIYYMKAKSIANAREVAKKSLLPIDVYHKECREKFCEEYEKLEPLLDFHRIKNFE